MAVNESNNGNGVNTVASGSGDDFGTSELARIGEQYNRVPAMQKDIRRRYKSAVNSINTLGGTDAQDQRIWELQMLEAMLSQTQDEGKVKQINEAIATHRFHIKEFSKNTSRVSSLRPRINMYNASTRERLNERAVNAVGREMSDSSVNGYVSGLVNSSEVQTAGLAMASQHSFEDLAGREKSIMGQIGGYRNEAQRVAGSLIGKHGVDPKAQEALNDYASKIKELATQLGPIAAAKKTLKELGQDPESVRRNANSLEQKARGIVDFESLRADISSGKGEYGNLTPADLKKKEVEAATNLIKAMEDWRNSMGKSKEEVAKFSKAAQDAAEKFEEVQMAGGAGAGGRSGNGYQTAMAYATTIAQAAALTGNAIQMLGINQPMAAMGNQAGFAAVENQKYDSWRSALGGNMTERMNLASIAGSHEFGSNRAGWARAKVGSNILNGGAGAVAGGVSLLEQIKNVVGAQTVGSATGDSESVKKISESGLALAESGVMVAGGVNDELNKISFSGARIAGNQVAMDAARKANYIPGKQRQDYRDHAMGAFMATSFMGGRGNAFLNEVGGASFMGQMQSFGLGSEEMSSLARFGAQNGSMFNSGQLLQAKRFENLGLGSAEENMRRMMSLSAGGSQNPSQSLEKMIERGMAVGLDSSKAISMIAESTGAMAESSAMKGMAGLGDEIGRMTIGGIDRGNPNQELAAKQSINAFQSGEQIRNNRSASWHGMIAISRIQKQLGLTDWKDANAIQGIDVAALRGLEGKSDEEIKQFFFQRGANPNAIKGDLHAGVRKIIESKLLSQAEFGGGMAVNAGQSWQDIVKFIGSDASRAEMIASGKYDRMPSNIQDATRNMFWSFQNQGFDPQATMRSMLSIYGAAPPNGATVGEGTVGSVGGVRGNALQEFTRGTIQKISSAIFGASDMTGRAGTDGATNIAALNETGIIAQQRMGSNAEAEWSTAAVDAAKSFGESAKKLDNASDRLTTAAETLISAANSLKDKSGMLNKLPDGPEKFQNEAH